ncbi:MAG: hypothetical protein LBQ28_05340 [Prevotellaceae bacterium]|jgi:hypothetical protein|nr:hypothetical protein [Prevotellaceae bacterium]
MIIQVNSKRNNLYKTLAGILFLLMLGNGHVNAKSDYVNVNVAAAPSLESAWTRNSAEVTEIINNNIVRHSFDSDMKTKTLFICIYRKTIIII